MTTKVYVDGQEVTDSVVMIEHMAPPAAGVTVHGGDCIRALNPRRIEEMATGKLGWGSQMTFTELVMLVIAEMLDSAAD